MKVNKSPTKRKPTKRVVKGWAIILPTFGDIALAPGAGMIAVSDYDRRSLVEQAKLLTKACKERVRVVSITITYHLPPKTI